jgi:hypothetical protein
MSHKDEARYAANPEALRRREERVKAALPVHVGAAHGLTRDVSASGVYFETTTSSFVPDSPVEFAIDLDTSTGTLRLRCRGYVVRVEVRGAKTGVAVKIAESTLEEAF